MTETKLPAAPERQVPDVRILWTGGFDSTLRILQLSRMDVIVQPYYLVDSKYRNSIKNELEAMEAIMADIKADPLTRFVFKPLIKADVSGIKPGAEVLDAWKRLDGEIGLGSQYPWLASFAEENPGIELTIEKNENGHLRPYFRKNGEFVKCTEGDVSYLVLDRSKSGSDMMTIFGNFHFPYPIFETTKQEMIDEYKKLGFGETMRKTWFCHNPVRNEPCGVCTPCRQVIAQDLLFRIPSAGMKRYETEMKFKDKLWFKYFKKIRLRIAGY